MQDPSTINYTMQLVAHFMVALKEFFVAIDFTSQLPHDQVSCHYPLHRYISCLISNALKHQGAQLRDFKISKSDAKMMMAHPLQVVIVTIVCV